MLRQSLQLLMIAGDISCGRVTTMPIFVFDKRLNSTPLWVSSVQRKKSTRVYAGNVREKKETTNAEADGNT